MKIENMIEERQEVLQDYIAPIVHYNTDKEHNNAIISKLFGSVFFITEDGVFLTAAHVLQGANQYQTKNGGSIGLNIKARSSNAENLMLPISSFEYAPNNYDIAIGKIDFPSVKGLFYQQIDHQNSLGRTIASYGYPETALHINQNHYNINIRCLRGYIQRHIGLNELDAFSPHPQGFELSFPIPSCMSGAPLICAMNAPSKGFYFLGICIGAIEAGFLRHQYSEVVDDNKTFTEVIKQIETYGLALSLNNILDWKPTILLGKSISEILS